MSQSGVAGYKRPKLDVVRERITHLESECLRYDDWVKTAFSVEEKETYQDKLSSTRSKLSILYDQREELLAQEYDD